LHPRAEQGMPTLAFGVPLAYHRFQYHLADDARSLT
jgi:hypothetical protein